MILRINEYDLAQYSASICRLDRPGLARPNTTANLEPSHRIIVQSKSSESSPRPKRSRESKAKQAHGAAVDHPDLRGGGRGGGRPHPDAADAGGHQIPHRLACLPNPAACHRHLALRGVPAHGYSFFFLCL